MQVKHSHKGNLGVQSMPQGVTAQMRRPSSLRQQASLQALQGRTWGQA